LNVSSYEQLLRRALDLPEKDRLWLAEQLILSVKPPGIMSIDDPGCMDEIMRRSDELHSGATDLIPGEVAIEKLEEIISRSRSEREKRSQ
jgi:hypothetical protein